MAFLPVMRIDDRCHLNIFHLIFDVGVFDEVIPNKYGEDYSMAFTTFNYPKFIFILNNVRLIR